MRLSDEDLWNLMCGNTIRRSWTVWSSGYCPSCKEGVPELSCPRDRILGFRQPR